MMSVQSPPSSFSSSPTPTRIPKSSSSSSDTVPGATIAGAVVGRVVGVAALLVIGYVVLRRYRRGRLPKEEVGNVSKHSWGEKKTENGTHNMYELPSPAVTAEIGGNLEAHELPGRKLARELPT
jgi:hypothetical protein